VKTVKINGVLVTARPDGTVREEFCQRDEFGRWVSIMAVLGRRVEGGRPIRAAAASEPEVRA
jgi:hypothetical protein